MLSFVCNSFDSGPGEKFFVMANDANVECVEWNEFSMDGGHGTIKIMALLGGFVAFFLPLGALYLCLVPISHILEDRLERKCSPLIDFTISRWRPGMWRFAIYDVLRRIMCTSGLLLMPDIQVISNQDLNF